jgi:hypothetical protein
MSPPFVAAAVVVFGLLVVAFVAAIVDVPFVAFAVALVSVVCGIRRVS